MPGYDLHTHSTFSDGTTSVTDNVRDALAIGLEGLGVTDHDTTAPFAEAYEAAAGTRLEIVPGTEFSAEIDAASVHVLGYWVDPGDPALVAELARLFDERTDRARRIVERFRDLGVGVSFERVAELAGDAPIARPHIAQAVVEAGGAETTDEVFVRFLADGGPAYVEKHAVDPADAVVLLRAAGGVAVLAHPGLHGSRGGNGLGDEVIERLAGAGLDGIEADHPDHTDDQRRHYRDLARGLGLEVTGGSDYHGAGKHQPLGAAVTPRSVVERLRARRP
jgi:3',5'-nucleoside bisphosphate phosphatase